MTAALSWCKNVSHSTVKSWNVGGLASPGEGSGSYRRCQSQDNFGGTTFSLCWGHWHHTGPVPCTMQQHTEEHREPRTARNHPDSGCPEHHHGSPESTASHLPLHYRACVRTGGRMAVLYLHRFGPSTASPASGGHLGELALSERHQTHQTLPAPHLGPASTPSDRRHPLICIEAHTTSDQYHH